MRGANNMKDQLGCWQWCNQVTCFAVQQTFRTISGQCQQLSKTFLGLQTAMAYVHSQTTCSCTRDRGQQLPHHQ